MNHEHEHHPGCSHGDHGPIDDAQAAIPYDDAQIVDSARRQFMAAIGEPLPMGDVPPMTVREIAIPDGAIPVEIADLVIGFGVDSPPIRARFTNHIRTLVGLPGLKPVQNLDKGFWTWTLGVRTRISFDVIVSIWQGAANFEGVDYVRIDGLMREGLWAIEHRRAGGSDGDWRLLLSGVQS